MRRAALPLLAILLIGSFGVVTASPQPTPICGVCGAGLEQTARWDDAGPTPTVTASTATVRVSDDGSATWHVTNELENESVAAYYARNPETLDRIVRDAIEFSTVDGPFAEVSASVAGSTIHVRFEDPDAARETPGDILIVEYFHSRGYDDWPVVTADRITVVGPEGTTVANDPPGASVSGRNATWRGSGASDVYEAPTVESDAYVVYADGGIGTDLWTTLGVAIATAPIVVNVVALFFLPPLLVATIGTGVMATAGRRILRRPTRQIRRPVTLGVVGVGVLALLATALGGSSLQQAPGAWVFDIGLVYTLIGGVALRRGGETRVRTLLSAGVVAVAVKALAVAVLLNDHATVAQNVELAVRHLFRLTPLVAMVFLGAVSVTGERRETVRGISLVAGMFVLALLTVLWPTQRPSGFLLVAFLLGAVGFVFAGAPLFALGGVVATDEPPSE